MDAPGAAIWSRAAMLGASLSLWKQPLLTLTSKVTAKNRIRFCQVCSNFFPSVHNNTSWF